MPHCMTLLESGEACPEHPEFVTKGDRVYLCRYHFNRCVQHNPGSAIHFERYTPCCCDGTGKTTVNPDEGPSRIEDCPFCEGTGVAPWGLPRP